MCILVALCLLLTEILDLVCRPQYSYPAGSVHYISFVCLLLLRCHVWDLRFSLCWTWRLLSFGV